MRWLKACCALAVVGALATGLPTTELQGVEEKGDVKVAKEEHKTVAPKHEETHDEKADDTHEDKEEVDAEEAEEGYSRWLWWLLIAYMFYAQAEVCDEYFVEAIKVCVEKFQIPDDVAGATLMALGCNGPELFSNVIAIFVYGGSDVGVGTIVGSEIFNLLCIVGGSIIVSPKLPLVLDLPSFTRDVSFYALSIVLLAWTLQDGQVSPFESAVLFACAILFVMAVVATGPIVRYFSKPTNAPTGPARRVSSIDRRRTAERLVAGGPVLRKESTVMTVDVVHHNRLVDSKHVQEMLREFQVTQQGISYTVPETDAASSGLPSSSASALPLLRPASFRRASVEAETLRQPLVTPAPENDGFQFTDVIAVRDMGGTVVEIDVRGDLGDKVTLHCDALTVESKADFLTKLKAHKELEIEGADEGAVRRLLTECKHEMKASDAGMVTKLGVVISFPVRFCLAATIGWADVRDERNKDKWLIEFCLAMAWLGVFSYLMCSAANELHAAFGLPLSLLGVTVCALGTSFPNFWASLIMAREGRSSMAVSNALGSNVQNVFLALALPWLVRTTCPTYQNFPMPANGIFTSVLWMGGTLLVLIAFVVAGKGTLGKGAGWFLVFTYVVYLVDAIRQSLDD